VRRKFFSYAGKTVVLTKTFGGYHAVIDGQHFAIRATDWMGAMFAVESIINAGGSV
jgi:hypothetical protein